MMDFRWQILCQFSTGKLGYKNKVVTANFTAFFNAKEVLLYTGEVLQGVH